MSIGQKFEKVADVVYEKGKTDIISNSKYIEKQATGKVIRLDDVSEIPHKVRIKAGINYFNNDISLVKEFVWLDLRGNEQTAYGYLIEDIPEDRGYWTFTAILNEEINNGVYISVMELYDDNTSNGQKTLVTSSGNIYIHSLFHDEDLTKFCIIVNGAANLSEAVNILSKCDFVMNKGYNSLPYEPAEVKIYGKNLFNNDTSLLKEVTYQGSTTQDTRIGYEPIELPEGEYTFTVTDLDTSFIKYIYGSINDKDGNYVGSCSLTPGGVYKGPVSITVNKGDRIYIYNGHTGLNISERAKAFEAVEIQLEPGPIGTEFEEFKEPQTIIATTEGAEIPSDCEGMSLFADNDITVDYRGSWGKYEKELEIWKSFTVDGKRSNYQYGMAYSDFSEHEIPEGLCTPKVSIGFMFYAYAGVTLPKGIDCSGFNTEAASSSYYLNIFGYSSKLRRIYDMGIPALKSYASCYRNCSSLEIIEVIRVNENTVFDSNSFYGCNELIYVGFVGTIGKNINLHWSTKLNRASILSLLQCLKASVTDVTITLPSKCIDTATDTLALIQGDTELNTAYTQALANGYTIAFQ